MICRQAIYLLAIYDGRVGAEKLPPPLANTEIHSPAFDKLRVNSGHEEHEEDTMTDRASPEAGKPRVGRSGR
jgi:hypothetical protein